MSKLLEIEKAILKKAEEDYERELELAISLIASKDFINSLFIKCPSGISEPILKRCGKEFSNRIDMEVTKKNWIDKRIQHFSEEVVAEVRVKSGTLQHPQYRSDRAITNALKNNLQ